METKVKKYNIPVNKYSIYKAILTVINFNLKLSGVEIDILATLCKYGFTHITVEARDILRKALDKDQYNINNYIKRLKSKNMILETEDKKLYINPSLKEILDSKEIIFKFNENT
jgi:hypothetical protein